VEVGQVPVPLVEVEAVSDEELVGNREADVAQREVVDEPPVGPVEERGRGQRPRRPEPEGLEQPVQRQAGVDHVLDEQHVLSVDRGVEVLQQPDAPAAARLGAAVACELDEVEPMGDRDGAREIGDEDEARLQQPDEERVAAGVVLGDLRAELGDASGDLLGGKVELADRRIAGYEARSSLYRCARRSMSRL
jgi:hypothetical protein